jgi:hypothetical protein
MRLCLSVALAVFCSSLLLLASPCSAQYGAPQPQYVGIPSFAFTPAAQEADELCWAASIQMILNYYHIPITQKAIIARVKGAPIDEPGSDADISNSLDGWAPAGDGSVWVVRSVTAPGPPPPLVLLNELSQGHPILLTFATGVSTGHAVVITAASYVPSAAGPVITSLVIRDPWPSPEHIQTSGRVEYAYNQLSNFLPLVRSYWLVSVTSAPSSTNGSSESDDQVSSDGESSDDSDECEDLKDYARSAVHNFNSLKGHLTDSDSDSSTYEPKHGIDGFSDCEIDFYKTDGVEPSAICDAADDADLDELWGKVKACFPNTATRHRETSSGEEYELSVPDGVAIRLRSSSEHIRLWVDAPDEE